MTRLLMAGLAGLLFMTAARGQEGGAPVKIGVAAPMTGPNAAFGAQIRNGVSQAVEDINKAGTLKGTTLTVTVGDDASDPKQGVSVANKFASDGVKMVVGDYNSGVTIPASDVYLDAGIIQVTPASTSVKFTERGMWNTFRTCSRDDQQGAVAGTYLAAHFKGKKIAFVHDKTPYGKGLADETLKALKARGGKDVLYEGINPGEKDYSALVSKLKSANVDVVYFGGVHTEAGLIIRQMRDQGLTARMMSGDAIPDKEFVQIAGPGAAGTLMTFAPDARKNPNARGVVAAFNARGIDPEAYTLYSYAAVQVLAKAMAETGSSDGKALADWLHQGKPVDTVVGPIAYDRKGDLTRPDYVIYEWTKGPDGRIDYAGHEVTP
ncbi:branched-chain amino acid ABC transporter substrate-binding protein [Methylobacterium sp. NMS12]|uniref:branched-chain amino acid ABC transporter substrate-binding protein n=1 Tax=Methylobacterium sp. NMS12 TaxID=3079766 RepID=UPI003F885BAD